MPAVPAWLADAVWEQVADLLPPNHDSHPLGCHRPRIDDRVVFDKLVQMARFGISYREAADRTCSATTLRRRRDEWIDAGVIDRLREIALAAYDSIIGLETEHLSVDGCITKAPCGGEGAGPSPVDRRKKGLKRSSVVDANGIPLGEVAAPANINDHLLLDTSLATLHPADLPEKPTVHLDRGYDYRTSREELERRCMQGEIARRGTSAPVQASQRWVIERTNSWVNNYRKVVRCTERRMTVILFWLKLINVLVTVARLVREAWIRYRWDRRPPRRP